MRPETYKDIVHHFLITTTTSGLKHTATGKFTAVKMIWLVLFAASASMFALQAYQLIQNYLSYPTSINTQLGFKQLPFPVVTVCNLNPYKRSQLGVAPELAALVIIMYVRNVLGVESRLFHKLKCNLNIHL